MKKGFTYFLIVLLGGITFQACKKYEEGPFISFSKRQTRVVKEWWLKEWFLNEENQTSEVSTSTNLLDLHNDQTYDHQWMTHFGAQEEEGTWSFISDDTELQLINSAGDTIIYNILKLKKSELWLRKIENNESFEYRYIPYDEIK